MKTLDEKKEKLRDVEIVQQVLNGDSGAYEQLMRRYNQRLFRVGMSYLNHENEVEDAMQNTYLKAFDALSSFKNESKFSTWLIRIMINECLQLLRKKRIYQRVDLSSDLSDLVEPSENGEEKLIKKELKLLIEKSILTLPAKYKPVYVLRELEGLSTSATAEILNISESNVKIRLYRAKEMLREEIIRRTGEVELFPFGFDRCNNMIQKVMLKI